MGRAQFASVTSLIGAVLIAIGFGLALQPQTTLAQDNPREYEGVRECRSCHGTMTRQFADNPHSRTMLEFDNEDYPPLANFSDGEDVRMVTFPGDTEARAFNRNDVAYTLGSGRHVQRYLYEVESGHYMVLPAEWNTVTGEWQAFDLGEEWPSEAYDFNQNCSYCHVTGLAQDTLEWQDEGVQCEACHGAGSDHIALMDDIEFLIDEKDREDLNASINIAVDPQTCGQCHSRGESDTVHPFPDSYVVGSTLSDAFTLVAPDDADHWYASGHALQQNMQYNEWVVSGHAASYDDVTSSDNYELECLTCHSSGYRRAVQLLESGADDPEVLPIPAVEAERLPFGVTCSTCHNPHDRSAEAEDFDHDAALYNQCTGCHQSAGEIAGLHHPVKEVFEGASLVAEVEPVEGVHFSADDGPSCTTCHMPIVPVADGSRSSHALNPISPAMAVDIEGVQGTCTSCHELVEGQSMQDLIDAVQAKTKARHAAAMEAVSDDTPQWVVDSLQVVENEGSWGVHNIAYSNALLTAAETELGLREAGTAPLVLPQIPTQSAPDESATVVDDSPPPTTYILGLTAPSLVFLGLAFGIIIIAGLAFFRGGNAR